MKKALFYIVSAAFIALTVVGICCSETVEVDVTDKAITVDGSDIVTTYTLSNGSTVEERTPLVPVWTETKRILTAFDAWQADRLTGNFALFAPYLAANPTQTDPAGGGAALWMLADDFRGRLKYWVPKYRWAMTQAAGSSDVEKYNEQYYFLQSIKTDIDWIMTTIEGMAGFDPNWTPPTP